MSTSLNPRLSRRTFLKWSAIVGGSISLVGCSRTGGVTNGKPVAALRGSSGREELVVPTSCIHNCGGRCLLKAHVTDGVITRLTSDDTMPDTFETPQVRACQRGRAQLKRLYHPDRLKYPMKRVGERGEGKFERISWDEALDTIAAKMKEIKAKYGNEAFYYVYASGTVGATLYNCYAEFPNYGGPLQRLLNLFGGYLNYYGNYSAAQYYYVVPMMFGALGGNSPKDLRHARLIVLWGHNPVETKLGGAGGAWYLQQAKMAGAKIIVIDPRYSDTVSSLADEWIPIRPGTDMALVSAIAYVLIEEGLYDQEFLNRYTVGFDEEHMPPGYPPQECYKNYILGKQDGQPKTPEWAEPITRIPANRIRQLAREMARIKPMTILQGWGMQRRAYGEQIVRGIPVLAAMTGNGGKPGSGPGLDMISPPMPMGVYPTGDNPVKAAISFFTFTDAIIRGTEMGPQDGVVGVERLPSNIKFIWNYAGNALINQHANIKRTHEILRDTSKVEFIVVHDLFMTPSARYADILLPDTHHFERNDIATSTWAHIAGTGYAIFMNKVIDPPYECRNILDICTELARRLGLEKEFTEGKNEEDWLREMVNTARQKLPDFPDYDTFKKMGIFKLSPDKEGSGIGFEDFYRDPEKHPLGTPSGKIQIFDPRMYDKGNPKEIPAIPKYIEEWESPWSPEAHKYPLQAIGHHYKHRVHSTFDNVDWLEEAAPQVVFLNPLDAEARGIKDGDLVRIFNDRGEIVMPCRVTPRIMPGVVDIPQGGWFTPDSRGIDRRGCINTLTSHRVNPLSFGNAQNTIQVQVEKA